MTETVLMTAKLMASSALLYAFYWLVLRKRASYTLARLYLLLIPFASLAMSGLTFGVYSAKTVVWDAKETTPSTVADVPSADVSLMSRMEQGQYRQVATTAVEPTAFSDWPSDSDDYFRLFVLLCGAVSVVLLLIATYHFISLCRISRRLEGETTPEGCRLIYSPEVSAPCSFIKTIFMPVGLSYDKDRLILEHEKAHIRHAHFVDVWITELMTRLLWFNPILWLARCELRNVHEFEADHDVLTGGADVSVYQTLLLAQVIDNGSSYANGFNHSFIRRRFVEMKRSTAGTLGRLGKLCMGVWMALLFCGFTFTEKSAESAGPTSISRLDLAEPQTFTIEGVVNDSISAVMAAVVLADDYLVFPEMERGDSIPVTFISDKKFRYSIPLKRMTAGRIRLMSPEGKIAPTWIDMLFVPGQTVTLNIHSNGEYALAANGSGSYFRKVLRDVNTLRNATNWQSPHLPKLSGKKWENVECESMGYPYYNVKEVIFGKNATYVRLYTDVVFNGGPIHIGKGAYLLDLKGNKYAMKWAVPDDTGRLEYLHSCVFGSYYAFEPVPDNVEELTFIEPDNEAGNGSDITIKHVFAHIKEAKEVKPNFQVDVTVTQGIDDSGYIVELFDHPYMHHYDRILADIPTHNRRCTFTTHLAKPYMGQFTATFPDGSVCTHSMRFPFVPGERAELTVKNGFFYLTGSKFYKEWGAADELVENARNFHKQEETDALIKDYFAKHANEEGCVMYYFGHNLLPKETIMKAMPADMLTGRFQDIMKSWYDVDQQTD